MVFEAFCRRLTPRVFWLGVAGYGVLMMLAAVLFFQGFLGLEPCPLCVLQRVYVLVLIPLALLAAWHDPGPAGQRAWAVAALLPALAGVATAARHVWLQSLPPEQLPACGPGLDVLMEMFGLLGGLRAVLSGSGECGEVAWSFLGLSLAAWTLVAFLVLSLALLAFLVRPPARRA
ncbi:MAG: hypothetical protein KatS3mg121_0428 [Gammaproteobacteria bacterium]|nr:MAG: hypothetical protein KatS3mg121_0428 [Gammaproteobacteria bacterium]